MTETDGSAPSGEHPRTGRILPDATVFYYCLVCHRWYGRDRHGPKALMKPGTCDHFGDWPLDTAHEFGYPAG